MKWGNDRISKNQLEKQGGSNLRNGEGDKSTNGNIAPKIFSKRKYSEHAIKQMGERKVPPSAVENAIKNGKTIPDPIPGRMQHHVPGGMQPGKPGLSIITDSESGKVITVITRSRRFVP